MEKENQKNTSARESFSPPEKCPDDVERLAMLWDLAKNPIAPRCSVVQMEGLIDAIKCRNEFWFWSSTVSFAASALSLGICLDQLY